MAARNHMVSSVKASERVAVREWGLGVFSGFTLLELLVVLAVVAVLVSFILPALARAKASAHRVQCQGNLRQIGIALTMYADDRGRYPPLIRLTAVMNGLREEGTSVSPWNAALLSYLGNNREVYNCRAYPARYRWTTNRSAGYFSFPANIQGNRPFCYAANVRGVAGVGSLGLESDEPGIGRKPGEIRAPSAMIAVGDDSSSTNKVGLWGEFVIWPTIGTDAEISVSRIHSGGANMVFLDCHVEWARQSAWLAGTDQATRRWNYDNEPHRECWE